MLHLFIVSVYIIHAYGKITELVDRALVNNVFIIIPTRIEKAIWRSFISVRPLTRLANAFNYMYVNPLDGCQYYIYLAAAMCI